MNSGESQLFRNAFLTTLNNSSKREWHEFCLILMIFTGCSKLTRCCLNLCIKKKPKCINPISNRFWSHVQCPKIPRWYGQKNVQHPLFICGIFHISRNLQFKEIQIKTRQLYCNMFSFCALRQGSPQLVFEQSISPLAFYSFPRCGGWWL